MRKLLSPHKHMFVFIIAVCCSVFAYGQTGTVKGVVKHENGNPLQAATVSVQGKK